MLHILWKEQLHGLPGLSAHELSPKVACSKMDARSGLTRDSFQHYYFRENTHAIWCFQVPYMLFYINALVFHIKSLTWRQSRQANIIRLVSSLAHQLRHRPSQVSEEWPVVLRGANDANASIAVWLWMYGSIVCLLAACHRCATIQFDAVNMIHPEWSLAINMDVSVWYTCCWPLHHQIELHGNTKVLLPSSVKLCSQTKPTKPTGCQSRFLMPPVPKELFLEMCYEAVRQSLRCQTEGASHKDHTIETMCDVNFC